MDRHEPGRPGVVLDGLTMTWSFGTPTANAMRSGFKQSRLRDVRDATERRIVTGFRIHLTPSATGYFSGTDTYDFDIDNWNAKLAAARAREDIDVEVVGGVIFNSRWNNGFDVWKPTNRSYPQYVIRRTETSTDYPYLFLSRVRSVFNGMLGLRELDGDLIVSFLTTQTIPEEALTMIRDSFEARDDVDEVRIRDSSDLPGVGSRWVGALAAPGL